MKQKDQSLFLGIYYCLTLIITSATTVTGVLVLQLHFQADRGVPVPGYLHRAAGWMAALSFTRYDRKTGKIKVRGSGMEYFLITSFSAK